MVEPTTPVQPEEERNEDEGISNFSWALNELKLGNRVARKGWNGKGMWLDLVLPEQYTAKNIHNGLLPWIGMKTADDKFVPWIASQTDLLAEDWEIVE